MMHLHSWRFLPGQSLGAGYCPCGAWGRQWYDFLSGGVNRVKNAPPPDDLRAVTKLLNEVRGERH